MNHLVLRTLFAIALIALPASIAGLMFGATIGWMIFSGGVVLLLFHHMKNAESLTRWLRDPVAGNVPAGTGAWEYVFSLLYRFERV